MTGWLIRSDKPAPERKRTRFERSGARRLNPLNIGAREHQGTADRVGLTRIRRTVFTRCVDAGTLYGPPFVGVRRC